MASTLMGVAPAPIRVLMLSHYFAQHRGGIEAVAAALGRELGSRGFRVTWLASGPTTPEVQPHYRQHSLAATEFAERRLSIPYPILRPSAWRRIFREAAQHDVIVAHDALYMTAALGSLAARVWRKPLLIIQHVAFVPFRSAFLRALMRVSNRCIAAPVLRGADQVVFISQLTQQQFSRIRWRRAPLLVFNGVDTATFWPPRDGSQMQSERQALNLPAPAPIVLFVGRFVEKKGLHIVEQMARLRGDLLFAFAGRGALDPRQWRLPNVRVYSELSGAGLAALYRASDVLLLPSVGEGFPLVVQEALACGLAVICGRDTACADELAAPMLTGVEVDLGDPAATAQQFCAALSQVLRRPHTAAERRARAEFAKARYSWQTSGERYAQILTALCDSRMVSR
jgi:glycosyltransferase involved in cell wall biosynthesis